MSLAQLIARITRLEAEVKRLKPVPGPGTLTSRTTRGVSRTVTDRGSGGNNETIKRPRWG